MTGQFTPAAARRWKRIPSKRQQKPLAVKKYTSKIKHSEDGTWEHEEIVLKPLNPEYSDIVNPNVEDEEFMVVAEVVGKCTEYTLPDLLFNKL